MTDTHYHQAEILRSLGQETRLAILAVLRGGERCVCEIFPAVAQEQSNVSRHLNLMQKAGLLSRRKEGLKIYYAIRHPEVLEIVDLASAIARQEAAGRHELLRAV